MKYFLLAVVCFVGCVISVELYGQAAESDVYIEIIGKPEIEKIGSELSDTLSLKFNLYKHKNTNKESRGFFLKNMDDIQVTASEIIGDDEKAKPPTYIEGSLKKLNRETANVGDIPSDITISLLVDRSGSIDEEEMEKIKLAIEAFAENVPEGCLYFSWFHDDISESIPLTKANFSEANLETTNLNTALYNAIYTKLLEFDNASTIPNLDYEQSYKRNSEIAKRNSANNYLIVLTDGVDDVKNIPKYNNPELDMEVIAFPTLNRALDKYKNKVKVYTLGFGESSENFDEEALRRICMASGNPNGYFLATPENILNDFKVRLTPGIDSRL
ncbi:MAG: VWA domain-containing protein [Bacteroidales bacterium]